MSEALKEKLKICLASPSIGGMTGLPMLIWGPPGGAKTAFVKEIASDMGLPLETVLLSVREPADVAGLPVVQADGGIRLEPPAWALRLAKAGEGILFFDELSCAAPAVQAAALRIVAERVVGDFELPPGIRIVAATNTAEEAAGGWDLAAPLANRFIHVDHKGPELADWSAWLLENSTDGKSNTKRKSVPAKFSASAWRKNYARAAGTISAFLRRKPGLLGPTVPNEPTQASRAWTSPRSWELATRVLAASWCADSDEAITLIAGAVGDGPAQELNTFMVELDLPDPAHILDGSIKFKHDPARLDRSIAILSSCAAYAKEDVKLIPKAWGVMESVLDDAPDVAVPPTKMLHRTGQVSSKQAQAVLAKLNPILSRARIGG